MYVNEEKYQKTYLSIFNNVGKHDYQFDVFLPYHSPKVCQGNVLRAYK